jgi:cbb3-type cytochrome c oxidase subunit III
LQARLPSGFKAISVRDHNGKFPEEQVKQGAGIYARNCRAGEKNRFVTSVTNGKSQMPPWGGVLQPADIESLWAYVIAGER